MHNTTLSRRRLLAGALLVALPSIGACRRTDAPASPTQEQPMSVPAICGAALVIGAMIVSELSPGAGT